MNGSAGAYSITWISFPRLELYTTDNKHNTLECFYPGSCILREKGKRRTVVDFPLGWRTDVTTTPAPFLLRQLGPHGPAAVLHDRLLQIFEDREEARKWTKVQLDILVEQGHVCPFHSGIMMSGLFLFDKAVKIMPWRKI